jgi:NitT/TauT family transport system ATP-binding protein
VKAELTIDLPRPRDEDDPRFAAFKQRIRELIHDEFEPER